MNDRLIDISNLEKQAREAEAEIEKFDRRLRENPTTSVPGDNRSRAVTGRWVPSDPEMLEEPYFCDVMRAAWKAGRGELEPAMWAIYQFQRAANALREKARKMREE